MTVVTAASREVSSAPSLAGVDVLAVDDNADALQVLEAALTDAGATVRTAASGPEALAAWRARSSDVLLCDLSMPQMQVGHVEGALLRILVAASRARSVLEIGTFSGYSGLCMASALPDDGRLVTCDLDPVATAVARRYFAESGHGHKIDLRLGPALDTIAALAQEGRRFDLVFIDADKANYCNYWDAVLPLVPVPSSPTVLSPQHRTAPDPSRAHAWLNPDVIASTPLLRPVTSVGMWRSTPEPSPTCPTVLLPQHFTPPPDVSAQV